VVTLFLQFEQSTLFKRKEKPEIPKINISGFSSRNQRKEKSTQREPEIDASNSGHTYISPLP
jgi:hypothetical protein